MTTTPIAATAGAARQRLASSLATLQQDPTVPPAVVSIVEGLARAMGPLFQIERGTGPATLLYDTRAVLQETLGAMQNVDQSYPGVTDATAAIAQCLGMIFAAIKEHGVADPSAPKPVDLGATSVDARAPVHVPAQAARPAAPAVPTKATPAPTPTAPTANPFAQAAQPVPLTRPAAQAVPLTQPAAKPVPLVNPYANPGVAPRASKPRAPEPRMGTVFPETAAKPPVGPNGLPRIEAEIDAFSDTNFFTNFVGDIRDRGGLFVGTYAVLAVGTACEVELKFPGNLDALFEGVVRWRRDASAESTSQPGMGVEITRAPEEVWSLIYRFLQKRDPMIHDV